MRFPTMWYVRPAKAQTSLQNGLGLVGSSEHLFHRQVLCLIKVSKGAKIRNPNIQVLQIASILFLKEKGKQ